MDMALVCPAASPPCGAVVSRGSGGGRRGRTEKPKALGFPIGEYRVLSTTPSPSSGPVLLVIWPCGCSLGAFSFFLQLWNSPGLGGPPGCAVGATSTLLPRATG